MLVDATHRRERSQCSSGVSRRRYDIRRNVLSLSVLSHSAMLFISCQIAGALSYLESRQLIHRDVSTRNCLVFSDYIIKLTDVAMGSPMYAHCYVTEAHLPVRWMSPEILMVSQFECTCASLSRGVISRREQMDTRANPMYIVLVLPCMK